MRPPDFPGATPPPEASALSDAALQGRRCAIWGTGKEGRAAARVLVEASAGSVVFLDDTEEGPPEVDGHPVWRGQQGIVKGLAGADVLVKSPGVSLYRPEVVAFRQQGGCVTSLLNLWFARRTDKALTIGITGTKGKSTTAALLAHVLTALGRTARAVGNIGTPVTDLADVEADVLVVELSSYQTADMAGVCDVGLVTSLYPEHLNWHGDVAPYYRDKLRLLEHARVRFCHAQVKEAAPPGTLPPDVHVYDTDHGPIPNAYLARAHNRANVGGVLAITTHLGFPEDAVRQAFSTFEGLPHRQQELGTRGGTLYVDDSIATTPQAAIAAMNVYPARPLTLIAGGFDRGIDYQPLVDYVRDRADVSVVCLGPSGDRIAEGLRQAGVSARVHRVPDMAMAVHTAQLFTPPGGAILLSPAAPSFGLFRDYQERGEAFAQCSGFKASDSDVSMPSLPPRAPRPIHPPEGVV